MNIADFCLKHKVTTIMAYVLIVIFGIMGFTSLPLALMPDIELPMAVVYTTYSDAGPQEVEKHGDQNHRVGLRQRVGYG